MAVKLEPEEIVALEDLAISNMWEIAAIVEVMERKERLQRGTHK